MTTRLIRNSTLALHLLATSVALAQVPTAPTHSFEVVSIRENTTGWMREFQPTPRGFRATNLLLLIAIAAAYPPSGSSAYGPHSIIGIPDWARNVHYDISATVPEADLADWQNPQLQPGLLRSMLQSMLRERFKFAAHRDTKVDSAYSLVVAPGGPKLQPTDPTKPHPPGRPLPWGDGGTMGPEAADRTIHFYDMPLSSLAFLLSDLTPHPVQNDTGLTGRYDFVMQHPANLTASTPQPDSPSAPDPGPTIFSAVAELGLKLVPAKRTVETLVIDHVEKPSDN